MTDHRAFLILHPSSLYFMTPYATVNDALRDLLAQVQWVLGEHFIGMVLSGSLALGGFDPERSDIDFVVVTDDLLAGDLFTALQEMHARFDAGGSSWAAKVEAVYIPQEALRRYSPSRTRYPQIEKGRILSMDQLESGWIFQCYLLREHGMALAGPDPRTLIDPVDPNEMRRAVIAIPAMWLALAHNGPSWLEWLAERANQAFVVLTLCRLLYTLDVGAVASKPVAAAWAQQRLGQRWAGLIARALGGQQDHSTLPAREVEETVALIAFTVEQYRRWESSFAEL
ncbi:MAG: DUF4111 domain-containing protein [Caldilineaceae bacterium]|nr:DUF4111 domain-containing protein [Caldilineaceae bacterium]